MMTLTTPSAGNLQSRAHRTLRAYLGNSLKPHDISVTGWALLGIVAQGQHGVRPSDAAEQLGVQRPMITPLVREFQRRDLVKSITDTLDSRAKRIVLTPHGTAFVNMLEQKLRNDLHGLLSDVDVEDLNTYFRVLRVIANKTHS